MFKDKIVWFIYKLLNPKLRCYDKCTDECWEKNCRNLPKEDIEKWYVEYIKCFFKCEDLCIEKCFGDCNEVSRS